LCRLNNYANFRVTWAIVFMVIFHFTIVPPPPVLRGSACWTRRASTAASRGYNDARHHCPQNLLLWPPLSGQRSAVLRDQKVRQVKPITVALGLHVCRVTKMAMPTAV
jgi:hypothetical protein